MSILSKHPAAPPRPVPPRPAPAGRFLGLSGTAWVQIGVVGVLFACLFWPNFRRIWQKTNPYDGQEAANWSHSLLVPLIGLFYLYQRRDELLATPARPLLADRFGKARLWGGGLLLVLGSALAYGLGLDAVQGAFLALPGIGNLAPYASALCWGLAALGPLVLALDWGLGTLVGGMLLAGYGIWPGQNDYVKDVGLVVTLFGVVLTLGGWRIMRLAWFPIVFLICAIPWPGLVYSKIAIPLQYVAANAAVFVLRVAQVDAVVDGTRIVIDKVGGQRILNVAEACAGMRSLMTFITVGAAIAFLSKSRPTWQKLLIVASAVPIAIFCNTMRVCGQGLLDVYVSEAASEGFVHTFVGMVMLVPAFFLLLGVGWVLDQIFVDDPEDEDDQPASDDAPAAGDGPGVGPKVIRRPAAATHTARGTA